MLATHTDIHTYMWVAAEGCYFWIASTLVCVLRRTGQHPIQLKYLYGCSSQQKYVYIQI